ncbi:hypothetical protein MKQ68_00705 [Chitinophaga horti]|uniref:Uncharacterized protein n=1 Tax=Chitinophaga horti TaxID=2920382 RepID=A0ABY6J1Q7_9BACT|nr:hypothetical protein [Chitinophaga horti]UYQ93619.1 hypothetical protein MKQ68_00705 [Chitinophaga horti]
MKSGSDRFKLVASKEEGNSKEDFFEIEIQSVTNELKAGTYTYKEAQEANGKQLPTILQTKAKLYYDATRNNHIQNFVPFIANGHKANFYTDGLQDKLPKASPNCKLVIEKVENGKASGYFILGAEATGFKKIVKGDAMTKTFSTGFLGEMKAQFSDIAIL